MRDTVGDTSWTKARAKAADKVGDKLGGKARDKMCDKKDAAGSSSSIFKIVST